jgi:hypothetical protein
MHPHMLRHTFVTTMLDAGVDLRDVQIAARHAGPRTHHALRPSPQKPRPTPQLHPHRLHGLRHLRAPPIMPMTARCCLGADPHRVQQCRTQMFVGERRQLLGPEPADLVMFVGSDVRRRSLSHADKPGAEAYVLASAAYVQAAQMNRQASCYLRPVPRHLPGEAQPALSRPSRRVRRADPTHPGRRGGSDSGGRVGLDFREPAPRQRTRAWVDWSTALRPTKRSELPRWASSGQTRGPPTAMCPVRRIA